MTVSTTRLFAPAELAPFMANTKPCEVCGSILTGRPSIRHAGLYFPPCKRCEDAEVAARVEAEAAEMQLHEILSHNAALSLLPRSHKWSTEHVTPEGSAALRTVSEQIPAMAKLLRDGSFILHFWGNNGVGKTHLAHHLVHLLRREVKIGVVSSEAFTRLMFNTWTDKSYAVISRWESMMENLMASDLLVLDEFHGFEKGDGRDDAIFSALLQVVNANIFRQGSILLVSNRDPNVVIESWMSAQQGTSKRAVGSRLGTKTSLRQYKVGRLSFDATGVQPWRLS